MRNWEFIRIKFVSLANHILHKKKLKTAPSEFCFDFEGLKREFIILNIVVFMYVITYKIILTY